MPNTYFSQQALANDSRFRLRVKSALATVATQVLNENSAIPFHTTRATYARQVIQSLDQYVSALSGWLVMRTNLITAVTSYDFAQGATVTDAIDSAIESQFSTDWNILSG